MNSRVGRWLRSLNNGRWHRLGRWLLGRLICRFIAGRCRRCTHVIVITLLESKLCHATFLFGIIDGQIILIKIILVGSFTSI